MSNQNNHSHQFKRSLGLSHLTAFGLNYMIPLGPAMILGNLLSISGGTVILPYILAGLGMLFTAMSYSAFVKRIPLAGSIYNYLSYVYHPCVGLIAGWLIFLDYLFGPTTASMSAALYATQLLPKTYYIIWLILFSGGVGLLNIFNVKILGRIGLSIFLLVELVAILSLIIYATAIVKHPIGTGHLLSVAPFHFSSWPNLASSASLAILTYIGFDATSTLAEEARHPTRDVPRAIYLSLFIGGLTMAATGYLAVLAMPDWQELVKDPNFMNAPLSLVALRTGGVWFKEFYDIAYLIAMAVSNLAGIAGGARLLYSMGRDGILPKRFFGELSRWGTPYWNIIFIVLTEMLVGIFLHLDQVAELVNFGAISAFFMLNVSVIWFFAIQKKYQDDRSRMYFYLRYWLAPGAGALVVFWLFIHLSLITLMVGSSWLILGLFYLLFRSRIKVDLFKAKESATATI